MSTPTASTTSRPRSRRIVIPFLATVLAAAAIAGVWYWRGRTAGGNAAAAEPTTATVSLAPYRVTVAGPGVLEAGRSLTLSSNVGGTIVELAQVGDRLAQGDAVALLDAAPFERAVLDEELALEQAEAQLASLDANQADTAGGIQQNIAEAEQRVVAAQREVASTEQELALTTRLHEIGSESATAVATARDTYDSAVAELASAQASLDRLIESRDLQSTSNVQERRNAVLAVDQAELDLEDAREDLAAIAMRAPFSGVVSEVFAEEGASVPEEGALLTLIDDTALALPVQIDETQISRVAVGQTADVELDAISDATFTGQVTAISPVAKIESNIPIFYVTVSLDNVSGRMRPGMTAEADIIVEEVPNAATVPLGALQALPNQAASFPGARPARGAATAGDDDAGAAAAAAVQPGAIGGDANGMPAAGADRAATAGTASSAPAMPASRADRATAAGAAPRANVDGEPLGGAPAGSAPEGLEAAADRRIVMVQQPDGSFAPVPVTVVDSVGFNAVVQGDLADGDVVLVPGGATSSSGTSAGQAGGGFPGAGRGGAFPGGGFGAPAR